MDQQQLWVEPVGAILMARVRGVPSEAILKECEQRVLMLAADTGHTRVLYDALEMDTPTVDHALVQQGLMAAEAAGTQLRRAIVVPNTRVAYLARLAFGEGDHRVFYNDIGAAINWLQERPPA